MQQLIVLPAIQIIICAIAWASCLKESLSRKEPIADCFYNNFVNRVRKLREKPVNVAPRKNSGKKTFLFLASIFFVFPVALMAILPFIRPSNGKPIDFKGLFAVEAMIGLIPSFFLYLALKRKREADKQQMLFFERFGQWLSEREAIKQEGTLNQLTASRETLIVYFLISMVCFVFIPDFPANLLFDSFQNQAFCRFFGLIGFPVFSAHFVSVLVYNKYAPVSVRNG